MLFFNRLGLCISRNKSLHLNLKVRYYLGVYQMENSKHRKQIGCKDMNRILVTQDRDPWRALASTTKSQFHEHEDFLSQMCGCQLL